MQLVGEGVGAAVVPEATALRLANERVVVRPLGDAWATRARRTGLSLQIARRFGCRLLTKSNATKGGVSFQRKLWMIVKNLLKTTAYSIIDVRRALHIC